MYCTIPMDLMTNSLIVLSPFLALAVVVIMMLLESRVWGLSMYPFIYNKVKAEKN